MTALSITPRLNIESTQGQYDALYFLPKLKRKVKPKIEEKEATRILRDLASDIAARDPAFVTPSTWLLRSFVSSHLSGNFMANWRESIYMTLNYIAQCASRPNPLLSTFVQSDRKTPLFPNNEGFTIKDTYRFAKSLIEYLDQQHYSVE